MGEWSKSIGEKGEEIVKFIFEDILNFNSLVENATINCIKGTKHKSSSSKSSKTTHGIDGLISYKSPVEDDTLDIGIISSKFTADKYPKSNGLFKNHLRDLADTMECFDNSKVKNDLNYNFSEVSKTELFGILVWLSNKSDINCDITNQVENILIDSDLIFDRIILLDNNKINFLYESVYRTQQIEKKENVDFVYHNSGLNSTNLQYHSYGKIFPINYLYSDIIPLRIVNDKKVTLSIYINDVFDKNELVQILNFAKSFDHLNAIDKTILHYKKYDKLLNAQMIKEKLVLFPNFTFDKNLEINKFPTDYRD